MGMTRSTPSFGRIVWVTCALAALLTWAHGQSARPGYQVKESGTNYLDDLKFFVSGARLGGTNANGLLKISGSNLLWIVGTTTNTLGSGGGGVTTNDMLALLWANGNTNWLTLAGTNGLATAAQLTGATNTATLAASGVLTNGASATIAGGGTITGGLTFDYGTMTAGRLDMTGVGDSGDYIAFAGGTLTRAGSIVQLRGDWMVSGSLTGNIGAATLGGVAVGGLVQSNDTRYLATVTNGVTSFLVGGTNLLVQSSAVDYRNKLTMNFGGLEAQYGGLWVGTNAIAAANYFILWSAADSYVGNAPSVYFNAPGTTGILRFRQNNQDKIVLSNAQVYIPATLNTALINGNGSGISNVNAATLGGVAVGGLVQTQELYSASNTLAEATALKANSNSVVTVVQTNSSGVAITNQFTVGIANPVITLPTISAGGGATVGTQLVLLTNIVTASFSSLDGWKSFGNLAWGASPTGLLVTNNPGSGVYTNCLAYTNWPTAAWYYDMSIRFVAEVTNGTSWGIGVGIQSANSSNNNWYSVVQSPSSGSLSYSYKAGTPSQTLGGPNKTALTTNLFLVRRRNAAIEVVTSNEATGASSSFSYHGSQDSTNTMGWFGSFGYPAIYVFGGTYRIVEFKYDLYAPSAGTDWLLWGDSIFSGQVSAPPQDSMAGRFCRAVPNSIGYGAGGDHLAIASQEWREVACYAPRNVILGGHPGNDVLWGNSYFANYTWLASNIVASGAKLWVTTPTARATDNSAAVLWLKTNTTFTATKVIDLFSATRINGGGSTLHGYYNSGDGIHPNALAQSAMYYIIINALGTNAVPAGGQ